MKKYVMLISFTLVCFLAAFGIGKTCRRSLKSVETVKVSTVTAQNSISCSGKVEYPSVNNLYAPASALIEEVYVKPGEHVTTGKALFKATVLSSADEQDDSQQSVASLYERLSSVTGQQNHSSFVSRIFTAPASGEVSSISVVAQTVADPTKPAVTLIGKGSLQARLSVNESQISNIKVGQQAEITGVGFKDSKYFGKVKSISSEAKQVITTSGQETVVEVVVTVQNPGTDIKPGYTAKVKIITAQKSDVVIAPYEAVRADSDGSEYVYCIKNNRAIKTSIRTSSEYENGFEVSSGLSCNDRIIINPDTVSNNTHVLISSDTMKGIPND